MTPDTFLQVAKDTPYTKRPQNWWDFLSILMGIAGAILWVIWGGIRNGIFDIDILTPILMIAVPVVLVRFRTDIDHLLEPLQPHRKKVSAMILILLGIAIPFITAWILFNIFHITQYLLIQVNLIIGTFLAYAITRNPVMVPEGQGRSSNGRTMILVFLFLCSTIIAPVLACPHGNDPTYPQGALQNHGYAEVLAGIISTILASLINGPIIIQGLMQGSAGAEGPARQPVPQGGPYIGDRRTYTDERGVLREAVLQSDGRWLNDEGSYTDFDRLDEVKKQYQENQAWMADQRAIEAQKSLADMDAYSQKLEAIKGYKSPEMIKFQEFYKDYLKQDMALNQSMADAYRKQGNLMNALATTAEYTEKSADLSIDVLAKMTGPQGKDLKTLYTTVKDITKNMSKAYAKGESIAEGFVKGVGEAGFDYGWNKGKESFIRNSGGNVPLFKNYKGGDFTSYTDETISVILNKQKATYMYEAKMRDAYLNSVKNMIQNQVQKILIKDPLKTFVGLK